ncbi:MAG: WD40/YVTN/BNR-like repeat-containing protein [Actinomycetota bacterium]
MRTPLSIRTRWTSSALAAGLLVGSIALAAPRAGALDDPPKEPVYQVTKLSGAGGEPNVSISPDGQTVLVDGLAGSPANLYRSTNGGATYTKVIFAGSLKKGGGDWDMHWQNNTTVIAADLSLENGIYVDRSTDGGLTWTQTTVHTDTYDRPWLGVSGNNVYLIAKGFDSIPYCYISTDGGQTFATAPVPIYGTGAVPAAAGGGSPTPVEAFSAQNAYIDHVSIDPKSGDLYVLFGLDGEDTYSSSAPFGTPSRLYVSHLAQGAAGPQFDVHAAYLGHAGDNFINGFNWMAIDRDGTIYVLGNGDHAGHQSTWLSFSKDHGVTWSSFKDVGEPGGNNVYGSIAAGAPGNLALVYLHGTKATPGEAQDWHAKVAQISGADTATPVVSFLTDQIGGAIHTADICMDGILCGTVAPFGDNRNLLDYMYNAVGPDGYPIAVVPSDGPASGGNGSSGSVAVMVIRQTAGPGIGAGAPS